jgi:hypothetical protein
LLTRIPNLGNILFIDTGGRTMNHQQALDLAIDNNIEVSVDREMRDCTAMRRILSTEFKVGGFLLVRARGQNKWSITSPTGGTYCHVSGPLQGKTILLPRGDAMKYAIDLILEQRAAQQ